MNRSAGRSSDLCGYYEQLQTRFVVRDRPDYADLVVASGNTVVPVHRWFHLKEAFSNRLLAQVLKDTQLEGVRSPRILDPFSGVGTTLASAADSCSVGDLDNPTVHSIESNPFLHLVGNTKMSLLQQPPSGFVDFARKVAASGMKSDGSAAEPPALSTFTTDGHFDPGQLARLVALRDAIDDEQAQGTPALLLAAARVCLGSIVEPVSNLRRDGRALRVVEKRQKITAIDAFLDRARVMHEDIPARPNAIRGRVHLGDGTTMATIDRRYRPFDLVLFSPPYPNNIDYTEIYKLENWLLGFIEDRDGFVAQRLATVYSHPSITRPEPLPSSDLNTLENERLRAICDPVVDAVPYDRYRNGRVRMIRGYVRDMYVTLRAAHDRMTSGGHLVYVVGNSLHGSDEGRFIIAADLLMAACAEAAGLTVERVDVARYLRRRSIGSRFLRESVVFVRRLDGQ